jgi:hypothetical protein
MERPSFFMGEDFEKSLEVTLSDVRNIVRKNSTSRDWGLSPEDSERLIRILGCPIFLRKRKNKRKSKMINSRVKKYY